MEEERGKKRKVQVFTSFLVTSIREVQLNIEIGVAHLNFSGDRASNFEKHDPIR